MHANGRSVIQSIPLSNDTVARRINMMATDVENSLRGILRTTEFSLQIDESTLPGNEALLLAYVGFIQEGKLVEEMLFARRLVTYSKGESIFKVVESFFQEKEIPLRNIIGCATDGAPAMVGRHRGFISHMKSVVPELFAIHCVVHREHLVAKHLSVRLHDSLNVVITVVNKIKIQSIQATNPIFLRYSDKHMESKILLKNVNKVNNTKLVLLLK